jgi:hypothetical protein
MPEGAGAKMRCPGAVRCEEYGLILVYSGVHND